jgi:hypothetical protein
MAQYARPDSDVAAGNWTTAPLYASLDETTPSDTDYIVCPISQTNTVCELGLSNVTDPASSSGHVVNFRAKKTGAVAALIVMLFQGGTQIATYSPTITTSYAAYSYTLSGAEADAITDYTNLRIKLDGTTGSTPTIEVSYVDFAVPDAGGSTYNEAVTVGRLAGVAEVGPLVMGEALSLARTGAVAEAGPLTMADGISLSRSGRIGRT